MPAPPFTLRFVFSFDDWKLAQQVRYRMGPLGWIRNWVWVTLYFAIVLLAQVWLGAERDLTMAEIFDPVSIIVYLVVAAALLPLLFWLVSRFHKVNYNRFFGKDSEVGISVDASGIASILKGASSHLPWALFNARMIDADGIHLQMMSADRAVMYLPRRGLDGDNWDALAGFVREMTPGMREVSAR
jgi:hypothetical protein